MNMIEKFERTNEKDKNHIQRCYILDAAKNGVSFADSHYSRYDCWEESWRYEFDDEIKLEKEIYEKINNI